MYTSVADIQAGARRRSLVLAVAIVLFTLLFGCIGLAIVSSPGVNQDEFIVSQAADRVAFEDSVAQRGSVAAALEADYNPANSMGAPAALPQVSFDVVIELARNVVEAIIPAALPGTSGQCAMPEDNQPDAPSCLP